MIRVLVSLLLFGLVTGCQPTERPPNIVLIYIDDLGWRDVGFMGSTYYQTPHIDRLAQEGLVFTNAYANAPNCAPSRAALMSGLYAPRTGVYTVASPERGAARYRQLIPSPNRTTLDTSVVTVAEALRAAGYATAHIGKWHLGTDAFAPEAQGFDVNVGGDQSGHPASHFFPYDPRRPELGRLAETGTQGEYLTDRLTDEALAFIDAHRDGPFFLNLAHYAVHTPIQAPDSLVVRYQGRPGDGDQNDPTYAAMIHSVDASVGQVLARLDSLGLTGDTLVLFYSDNGGYGPITTMAPLRGAKGMLYEGGIRVPLAMRWPGRIAPGRTTDVPVIGTDLYPTFLAAAGTEASSELDGVSLMPLLTGTADTLAREALYWHFPAYLEAYRDQTTPWRTTPAGAIRMGDYKLIEFFGEQQLELYDLRTDLGEQHNLAAAEPAVARRLHAQLQAWRERVGAPVPTEPNPAFEPAAYRAALEE